MQSVLSAYKYVILDFSAMFAKIDSSLIGALNRTTNLLVAPTFNCECEHVQKVVSYRIAAHYKDNKSRILVDGSTVCKEYGTIDTFALANRLSCYSDSVIVVEANYSLEDRIVLSGISVDVYNLFEKRLIEHNDYRSEAASRTIDKTKTPLTYYEIKSGETVYADSEQYIIADLLESGAEAQIFKVNNNPGILAKIYKEDEDGNFVLTSQKLHNINMLKEIYDHWDVLWLALPINVIYADPARTKPIGYIMKYFDEARFLSNDSLFSGGDINTKFPEHDKTTVKDVLEICIKFVSQILFLALNDIYISDYNDKNFAIPIKSGSNIVMIDTDSYCCEGYVSECITYSGCLSKKYECNTRLDLINLCNESLYAFIFTRLALDSGFVPIRKSEFRFSEQKLAKINNQNIRAKWNSIPKNLQNLFTNIFDKKSPASIDVLLYELEEANRQEFANTEYKDIYKGVLEITEPQPTVQKEVLQFKPAPPPPPSLSWHPKRKTWAYVIGVIGVILVAGVLLWFVFRRSDSLTNEDAPSEQSGSTTAIESSLPQLQRYESQDGYYLSYKPDLNGYVEFYWNNENSYKGNYSNGIMMGYGEFKWADGETYSGDFVDGQMTGDGTRCYSDGTTYIGAFLDGVPNGQGTLYDANNNKVYEGGWKEGFFNGEGAYYFPIGDSYKVTWENGTCHGGKAVTLKYESNNEPVAKGYWEANVFYGHYYKDGEWYELP